jgi:hypothetical protein
MSTLATVALQRYNLNLLFAGMSATESRPCPGERCAFNIMYPPYTPKYVKITNATDAVVCSICNPFPDATPEIGDFVEMGCNGKYKFHIDCMRASFQVFRDDYGAQFRARTPTHLEEWQNMTCLQCRAPISALHIHRMVAALPEGYHTTPVPRVTPQSDRTSSVLNRRNPQPVAHTNIGGTALTRTDTCTTRCTCVRGARKSSSHESSL